ncbi:hypothetical protein SLE2022_096290 [Rubroshorea leprosula]
MNEDGRTVAFCLCDLRRVFWVFTNVPWIKDRLFSCTMPGWLGSSFCSFVSVNWLVTSGVECNHVAVVAPHGVVEPYTDTLLYWMSCAIDFLFIIKRIIYSDVLWDRESGGA